LFLRLSNFASVGEKKTLIIEVKQHKIVNFKADTTILPKVMNYVPINNALPPEDYNLKVAFILSTTGSITESSVISQSLCDFRLSPRCKLDLSSFKMLRSVDCYLVLTLKTLN